MRRAEGSELRTFLGAFSPEIARVALRVRAFVLEEAPMANEFIDAGDDVVAMSYALTDRAADAFCNVEVFVDRVQLGFQRGRELADAEKRLKGFGRAMRHLKIESLDDLREPSVGRLLRAAIKAAPRSESDTGKRSAGRPVVRGVYADPKKKGGM